MTKGILGRKIGMTQVFTSKGELVPVTVIEVLPNTVLQVKTPETDGYSAVQLGVFDKRKIAANKPEQGHAKKANATPKRYIREIRDAEGDYKQGDQVEVSIFNAGEYVDVQGITKGHGFQGSIKRLGQSRGPMAHGSRYHRRPGSMGAIINKVFKGKLLPGQMGGDIRTAQKLLVVAIDKSSNLILIKGNVPGANKSFVTIKSTVKAYKASDIKLAGAVGQETTKETTTQNTQADADNGAASAK
ncbi:50S ribosomal protein L3 [Oenococcus kitaharae]|uniref:Large ribosomal subunit protein uL3 n=1 Tax=Oenococcus kitaharae DSM 17330 TaxID=1045004 RepID=G9WFH7_9LACO|nr:50S ribosomal protein L3 [Oenococcus kitaharae]EHN59134.1 LSU ribosomal protein L3p (L3e) [Oenococcus kitaharae DSM 17330]OEY81988.1 50S ribosomal protein L3 [Oenococcus kitaharae]OEY82359.1 50S ribosomal protein L3 [Oenococcus kitaharae]OEY82765.1 50S ribosomal protein L3 [Oenococcus kitaharae]